jgi:5-methylcytosine-specific restriction endonuclease McrA
MRIYTRNQSKHDMIKRKMFKKGKRSCKYCGTQGNSSEMVLDHIKPISMGGKPLDRKNLQLLCKKCNLKKTNKDKKIRSLYNKLNKMNNDLLELFYGN